MKNKKKPPFWLPVIAALLLAAAAAVCVATTGNEEKANPPLDAGLSYLEMRENKNPEDVKQIRKEIEKEKLIQQRDTLIEELTNGDKDPFSMFKDFVIMGDSRAVGFWYYNYLDEANVIADGGHTIRDMQQNLDQVVAINPSTVYLCYGLNDVSIGYWDTADAYVAEYMDTIRELQRRLPDTTVVVSAILPTTEQAFERSSRWRNIPQWSAALEKACQENGIAFANCDNLFRDYRDLWEPLDGIHFRWEMYPHWAINLIVANLMKEAEA